MIVKMAGHGPLGFGHVGLFEKTGGGELGTRDRAGCF